ncbi:MmcQ/YjbR family DNA-binding protein [Phenylobacterium sp. LH3H17]|uniref:MmcQ/YjbR family DNA-binding protein n=1 Tax=Phenylobacterium sp. LH3H17 TaxID=2903901 RepID=UPI0020C99052|nr:MmcQ/YjbR family DNA-binding protein [Phenylobacterium sp. LH3H17]UTP40371.1 MmcQ/YjbR family DNA-binding protein [Phenylobacterium sp. LH3H17]
MTRAQLEAFAMGLPAVTKVIQWGESDVFKVGGKVFAISGDVSVSFKVTEIGFMALTESGVGRQAPHCAKGQWVAVDTAAAPHADLTSWLTTAHGMIAAKLTKKAHAELGLA